MSVLKKFRNKTKDQESWLPTEKKGKKHKFRSERRSWEREGAWRANNRNEYFWFEGHNLDDLDQMNADIDDDDEFWKAFNAYVEDNDIQKSRPVSTSSKDDSKTKWSWTDDLYSGKSLSDYWSPWKKGGGSWTSDINIKVAIAIRSVQSTVSIIDDSGKPVVVVPSTQWERTEAYTDLQKNRIVISCKPLADKNLTSGEATDVMTGYGLHEASHSKYTRQVIHHIIEPPIKPMAIAQLLNNVLEDVRIEKLTSEEFPGFAGYLEKAGDYVFKEVKVPGAYGPNLQDKLNAVIAMCKWPDRVKDKVKANKYLDEFEWWTEWLAAYKDDGSNLRERVETGIAHLRNATEEEESKGKSKKDERAESDKSGQASDEMDEQEKAEQHMADMEAALADFLERTGIETGCAHTDHDPLEEMNGNAEAVTKLVDEEMTLENIKVTTPNGSVEAPVYVSKPQEDSESRSMYDPKPDPTLNLYKSALVFRRVDPHWSIKLQREGDMDDDELWRWAADDWRVFEERQIPHDPKARVGLLVDISGSMHGYKLDSAVKMAKLFIDALTSIHGVTPYVWAHTGDVGQEGSQVYRIWEPGDPISRIGLLHSLEHGNNYDGHAIAWVTDQLANSAMPDEQKVLIVLSDGLPSGGLGYGGYEGQQHVRIAVDDAQKAKDIRVLQIAIDTSVDEERQRRMFDEFIPFKPGDSLDTVPKRLTRWLEKAI